MSETSDRGGKPRKPAGPPGRGAAGGRRPTGSPQGNDSPKPRRSNSGDADRPKRDGDAKPRRDGDYKPRRDADGKPARRDADGKPAREYKPRRDADGKPPRRDGDYKPRRDGDARPPRSGDARPPRTGDSRPPRSGDSRPARSSDFRPARSGDGAPTRGAASSGRPRTGGPARAGVPARPYRDGDRPARPPRDDRDRDRDSGPRHDDPHIDDEIQAKDLDKVARAELKTLSKENADWVAKHLVVAGQLIDTDPALAHRHALAAARRAGRVAVVREAVGITAYAMGDFALALRELRTYRRISGKNDQLPLMVDSERGVRRPAAALELGRSVPRASLDVSVQVALAIAMSGARLDLGQPEAALGELQIPQLDPERAFSWSPALFDAYATVLEDLGHTEEAEQWWQRSDRATIALERADLPEGEDTVEIIEEELDVEPEAEPPPADPTAEPDTDAPTLD